VSRVVPGGKRIPSLCCQRPPKKVSVTNTEGTIHLVIAGDRGLFWETMGIVLDGEPDMCVRAFSHEGRSALELSEELKPDVLVLDGNLPNGDSLEMTGLLKERLPAVRILFVAEETDNELIDASLLAGVHGCLTKDGALDDFVDGVRTLARGEQFVPATMLGGVVERSLRRRQGREEALKLTARLTKRERDVLSLVVQGSDHVAIAHALTISPQTVRTHVQNVLGKLRVHSRREVIEFVQPLPGPLGVMS
jgi:DNA-binding NarL/FixJ family response regulator